VQEEVGQVSIQGNEGRLRGLRQRPARGLHENIRPPQGRHRRPISPPRRRKPLPDGLDGVGGRRPCPLPQPLRRRRRRRRPAQPLGWPLRAQEFPLPYQGVANLRFS